MKKPMRKGILSFVSLLVFIGLILLPHGIRFADASYSVEFNDDSAGNVSGYPVFIWRYHYAHIFYLPMIEI
jgi:hypothetical protein